MTALYVLVTLDPNRRPANVDSPEQAAVVGDEGILVTATGVGVSRLPDFSRYRDVKQKKSEFFAYMLPLVTEANLQVLQRRARLQRLSEALVEHGMISIAARKWLFQQAADYRVDVDSLDDQQLTQRLLLRVDAVPVSLVLSQSANESAWGTSRFALEGNNLFGQWCFRRGCGLVPERRPEGASYEVARFANPLVSVHSYIHNLNTNSAYLYFRELRATMREQKVALAGEPLAEGLMSYSIRGRDYITELQAMIRVNRLARYDVHDDELFAFDTAIPSS